MLRLLSDENFSGDIIRGLMLRQPQLDLSRVQDVGLEAGTAGVGDGGVGRGDRVLPVELQKLDVCVTDTKDPRSRGGIRSVWRSDAFDRWLSGLTDKVGKAHIVQRLDRTVAVRTRRFTEILPSEESG